MTPPTGARPLLGEILVKAGVIKPEHLDDGLKYQKETGLKIGECLVRLGYARQEDVVRGLARQAGLPFVDVRKGVIPREIRPKIKDWVFGCDECLTICPFSAKSGETHWPEFRSESGLGPSIRLEMSSAIPANQERKAGIRNWRNKFTRTSEGRFC